MRRNNQRDGQPLRTFQLFVIIPSVLVVIFFGLYAACNMFPFMNPVLNWAYAIQYKVSRMLYHESFNSTEWKRATNLDNPWNIRMRMSEDLIDQKILVGKTAIEVTELLGPPDDELNSNRFYDLGDNPKDIDMGRHRHFVVVSFLKGKVTYTGYADWD